MAWFKYVSFVGAACLILALAPWSSSIDLALRGVAALVLLWGACYYMLRENEILFGTVAIIFAVLVQPIFMIPFGQGTWLIICALSIIFLCLSGFLALKIEKQKDAERAKVAAELEMYRKNEEKLRAEQSLHQNRKR